VGIEREAKKARIHRGRDRIAALKAAALAKRRGMSLSPETVVLLNPSRGRPSDLSVVGQHVWFTSPTCRADHAISLAGFARFCGDVRLRVKAPIGPMLEFGNQTFGRYGGGSNSGWMR
jgi:hypothetical protein